MVRNQRTVHLDSMLRRLSELENDIRVVIIGSGAMGKGLLYQCIITPGFTCVGLADLDEKKALAAAESFGVPYQCVNTETEICRAIERGKLAISTDGQLIAQCGYADVVIEATSAVGAAGHYALKALCHGKDVVMMNAEADLMFGPLLMREADRSGAVYTSCDGDQHGVIMRLIYQLELWGMELVMAGNIKGYLDRYANPISIIPEADKRNLDYKMCTAYTDGTKLCIEMALLANALGLRASVPGMIGPRAKHVEEVFNLFDLQTLYSTHGPVVDYILGAKPDGGVFAIGRCEQPYQREMLRYYKMGEGPFYLLYRPYHLCHVEAMETIAQAHLDGESLLEPAKGFQTNVYAYAKRDLKAGEKLDGIGGHTCYGLIENAPDQPPNSGLPICLADNVTLCRDLSKDQPVGWDDVKIVPNRPDVQLYQRAIEASRSLAVSAS